MAWPSSPDSAARALRPTSWPAASRSSLDLIWGLWRAVPGTLLVPGHDLTMRLDAAGRPEYLGERRAGIAAWFAEDLAVMHGFDLSAPRP